MSTTNVNTSVRATRARRPARIPPGFVTIAAVAVMVCWLSAPFAGAQHLLHGASGLDHGIPNFCATTTIVSAQSGSWSDPATWTPARVPAAGDRVRIADGMTVTYDVVGTDALRCVGVDGTLRFKRDVDTQMIVGDFLIRPAGALEIGTEEAPIAADHTATVIFADQPIDTTLDPEQFGTGLVVTGRVRIHGSPKTQTYGRTTAELSAGQTALDVDADAIGWRPGDRVVIPDSRYLRALQRSGGWTGIEVVALKQIAGRHLTFAAPLRAAHPGARDADGKIDFLPHVGNLTRNVVFKSQAPIGTRGHVMFVARADVDVRYAEFQNLGRTTVDPLDSGVVDGSGRASHIGKNQIGRYSVHFHHLLGPRVTPPNGYQFTFVGNAVEGPAKWAITIHHSHYGLIKDNVLFDSHGSAIMTEDGSESFNVIEGNFIVKVQGDGGRGDGGAQSNPPDMGKEGTGIWLRGPNNYVRKNIVANASMYGYAMFYGLLGSVKIPAQKGADPSQSVDFERVKNLEFSDNEAYAVGNGMTVWYTAGAHLLRTRVWHALYYGFTGYPEERPILDGWVVRGDPAALLDDDDYSMGIWFGDYDTREALITNADIQNMRYGVMPPMVAADPFGGPGGAGGTARIENSYFRNRVDIWVATPYFNGGGLKLSPRTTIVRNSKFVAPAALTKTAGAYAAIGMTFRPGQLTNNVQKDRVFVYDFNQVPGDNFQVFYLEQAPEFVVPAEGFNGAAQPGVSNDENWRQHKAAVAGQVTPCSMRRPSITGFVCTITEPPAETPPQTAQSAH